VTVEGDVDYSVTPFETAVTMHYAPLGTGDIQMRVVDSVIYLQTPALGSGNWIKVPVNSKDLPLGGAFLAQMDPRAGFDQRGARGRDPQREPALAVARHGLAGVVVVV